MPTHIAEIRATGLLADQPALDQGYRDAALAQEECGRSAHDAAADHDHIRACNRAHVETLRVEMARGFTGACPRNRPIVSSGAPTAAEMISAAAWPQ